MLDELATKNIVRFNQLTTVRGLFAVIPASIWLCWLREGPWVRSTMSREEHKVQLQKHEAFNMLHGIRRCVLT